MDRAERAAETFEGMRKYFRASTPAVHGASRIYNHYMLGTQERWEVPCPACDKFQLLEIDQMIWDYDKDAFGNKILNTDNPKSAKIGCKHCGYLIDERERQEIIHKGMWVALYPDRISHRSYFFNRFTSPFSSLQNICKKYIEAQQDPEKMQVFTNLFLGLPYKAETVEEVDTFELMQRVESYLDVTKPYEVPNQTLFLVLSCDVQKNRLQVNVWAIGLNFEMWIINRYKFVGDPKLVEGLHGSPWNELKKLLLNRWKRQDGVEMGILIAGIDSSYLSDEVYNFCRGYEFSRKWWPIKGAKSPFAEIIPAKYTVTGEKRNKYLSLGVNLEKQSLFSRLKIAKPENFKEGDAIPKYIHFDESICDPQYFEEVTSERGNKKKYGNMEFTLYEKKKWGDPNEEWDLMVYASILAKSIVPNWIKIKENLDKKASSIEHPESSIQNQVSSIQYPEPKNNPITQQKNISKRINQSNSITTW
jgi:phage terminase large subunit GpA-like protein